MRKREARIAVIMSGGSGRRFWPLSRERRPKQIVPIMEGKSLLEATIERLIPLFAPPNIWVITKASQVGATEPITRPYGVRILSEPVGRNTAACIAYGVTAGHAMAGDPSMVFLPADHFVADSARFRSALRAGLEFVERHDVLLTMGIKPNRPATGFGYIRRGRSFGRARAFPVFAVDRFTEKPSSSRARRYVHSGNYLWNSGIFLFRASVMLEELDLHMPALARRFRALERHLGGKAESAPKRRCYEGIPAMSIDLGVMERSRRLCVMPLDVGWNDLGNWDSYSQYLCRDSNGNRVHGVHITADSKDCVIYADKHLVATVGVRGMIVIVTDDAVLVAGKDAVERVKDLAALVDERGFASLL